MHVTCSTYCNILDLTILATWHKDEAHTHKQDISDLEKGSFWLSIYWRDSCVLNQKSHFYWSLSSHGLKFWHILRKYKIRMCHRNIKIRTTLFIIVMQVGLKMHFYWCPFLSTIIQGFSRLMFFACCLWTHVAGNI